MARRRAPEIVDSQVHVWRRSTPERPWIAAASHAHHYDELLPEQALDTMDAAGVAAAVLIPPTFADADNTLCLAAAVQHPDRFAVMGRLPLDEPESAARVPGWLDQPGMYGFRLTFAASSRAGRWLDDGTADWFWPLAAAADAPVMIHAPERMDRVRAVAERHPQLRLAIDHAGLTGSNTEDQLDSVIDRTVTLAALPNVSVKASALPGIVSGGYPFRRLRDPVRRLWDAFGPERMFWGSDFTRLDCPYADSVRHFAEELDFLDDEDLAWVMGRGLRAWLRWNPGAVPA